MNKKNKILIMLLVAIFSIGISYSVFSWTEPAIMPSSYKAPINTSSELQDVDPGKPVIGNFNVEKLEGIK